MLNKSEVLSFRQCPRKLWLERNDPLMDVDEDAGGDRRKEEGVKAGEMAREMMPVGSILPLSIAGKEVSAEKALALLDANPGACAVEFPFQAGGVYARVDALLPEGTGYVLRETKATTYPLKDDKLTTAKPEPDHIEDLAIQAWAMISSGLMYERAELNLLNSQWRYPGNGDYSKLFRLLDVTTEVLHTSEFVPIWIADATEVINGPMPTCETGKQCSTPNPCPRKTFCLTLDPPKQAHPIELLPDSAGKKLAKKLRDTFGFESILDPQPDQLTGKQSPLYRRIQECHRTGLPYLSPTSGDGLKDLPYPRYYFDFEGIDLAIPVWEGVRPYEQIPFQWSCHIETAPGVFTLKEFLDLSGDDPSFGCIEHLRAAIDLTDGGPILVYFATYERGRFQELAERHPSFADDAEILISRMVDLLPEVKNNFYHPAMVGSFSIKKVLPVMAPDMNYGGLEEVQDGIGAQLAYIRAALSQECTPQEKAQTELNARIYCRQDTWAMVEVAYFLQQLPRPVRPEGM